MKTCWCVALGCPIIALKPPGCEIFGLATSKGESFGNRKFVPGYSKILNWVRSDFRYARTPCFNLTVGYSRISITLPVCEIYGVKSAIFAFFRVFDLL